MISSAIEKVGRDGVITVKNGKTLENIVEVTEGFSFDQGMISPYFVTDRKEQKTKFENPLVLVVEGKISHIKPGDGFVRILDRVRSENKQLLIIAENIEGEALATLLLNKLFFPFLFSSFSLFSPPPPPSLLAVSSILFTDPLNPLE